MSGFAELASGRIKSIQRGTISNSGTATITAVDTAKTLLQHLGISSTTTDGGSRLALTNSTTITATHFGTGTVTTAFQAVEYY